MREKRNLGGWIKLHRKFKDWGWYSHSNTVHLFIHLLLSASTKSTVWNNLKIERGQAIVGRKSLASELGLSEQQIRTSFSYLKSTNEITITSTTKFSVVTVVNYDKYQGGEIEDNQPNVTQVTNEQPHLKNNKKNKNKEDADFEIPENLKRGIETWVSYRKEIRKPLSQFSIKQICKKYQHDPAKLEKAVEHSVSNGWQGLFEPKGDPKVEYDEAMAALHSHFGSEV